MKQILALLLLIAASCLAVSLSAQTVRNVPGTYATIAAAISASANGDIIEIAAGTYTESGLTVNKSLTFRGAGQTSTIIQAAMPAQ
jgi:nitrous oxidase accessory protein NosD